MARFDAILIPGGGLTATGALPPFVCARLDRALAHSADFYIPLSAATTHFPSPLDAASFPIFEAIPAARYLHERGVPQQQILTETSSYDTIGNAFFARAIHTDPRALRHLLIVTSEFHMPRTEAIFRWVFDAAPHPGYELSFEASPDAGLSQSALESRAVRERASLESVRALARRIGTFRDLHQWIYTEHAAYAWFRHDSAYRRLSSVDTTDPLAESYGGAK